MTYEIQLTITAVSPLAIGRQKPGGSVSEAESYIPGSVIRGALASEILRKSPTPEPGDDFHSLFLGENAAIFQNGYPAIAKVQDKPTLLPNPIQVLPATAVSSKTNSGFKTDSKNHGVFDTLIDRFCAGGYNHPYDPNCPKDCGRVEPYSGFYACIGNNYYPLSTTTRLLTRVGINRRRATSEEQVIYSIEVLNEVEGKEEPATYRSKILLDNEELANALTTFINSHSFRLGGSASRGLGKAKIIAALNPVTTDVKPRIDKFNRELQERWKKWQLFGEPQQDLLSNRTYFTLDLQSDAIFTENWQRTTVINDRMLKKYAAIDDPSLELHVAYTSYDYRSGWNAAWGLMKDVELVTNKGGVYLFSTSSPDLWYQALGNLEIRGVGERTSEGFGQVQVCNEFHLVFRENAV
ncbi:CRISPR-associated RAMP protein Csx10 [Planktothrix sp. FACHB-1355]|uniref:CRISPR-associated RAMP protein Csx10 n=1 Tax=Aerosakkonema funiforme FACHB-1375 TaxID=2949571 RepID=A0A926VET0_9CYAN|nr:MULTISPECIES: CRISPR-associated RAMP protein Csx10 [Oscillatoriales]MBD2182387.1 CRISPR-associated RAMP protein Csx10 [Aerosakkonema funiforme FACHB-1375]MBD3559251.1 CRISPR-associated RAMP protein Csx10 [Planktothrix sp. FACHB-1355]